jgi:hypothetical protein
MFGVKRDQSGSWVLLVDDKIVEGVAVEVRPTEVDIEFSSYELSMHAFGEHVFRELQTDGRYLTITIPVRVDDVEYLDRIHIIQTNEGDSTRVVFNLDFDIPNWKGPWKIKDYVEELNSIKDIEGFLLSTTKITALSTDCGLSLSITPVGSIALRFLYRYYSNMSGASICR